VPNAAEAAGANSETMGSAMMHTQKADVVGLQLTCLPFAEHPSVYRSFIWLIN
jgi:hypothetical protein